MAKIIAPNKEYTGISASVSFIDGVGKTDKPELIDWFKFHGYEVVETVEEATETVEEVKEDSKKKKSKK